MVDENYIAVSQDADWLRYSEAERTTVAVNKKIRTLRDYQVDAVRALQQSAIKGQNRFLFEMATGTGKTLLSAAIAKLYLRTENATRILFLVDRLELERQAWQNFRHYLASDAIETVIYKQTRQDWKNADVVVTTIQSLAARNRFLTEFAPTDFQLIISDEAHRTISGNNRVIFEYFVGAKLGLTATPRDYLKGVNEGELRQEDPRALEKRLLLDTYNTFGCADGTPTFRYSLMDAIKHEPPYLVNPVALDARTTITSQMLSDEGYTVTVPADEDGEESELVFGKRDYEKRFFSDETNLSFVRCFLDHAARDPLTGEIGKAICFAVKRTHAAKLVKLMNEEATRRWPEAYDAGSSFAAQVTTGITGAQGMSKDFANNHLNGVSKWHESEFRDYKTSRTRVCVTVDMMTTGYDCEDLLKVVLARPIFSPTDFIQIKGRGTRLYTFKHHDGATERSAKRESFALFDFFANCEFFEEDFDYDEQLPLPTGEEEEGEKDEGGGVRVRDEFANTSPDPIAGIERDEIGTEGMKIDREMYRDRFAAQAREAMHANVVLQNAVETEDWPAVEHLVRELLFDRPEEHWNLARLRELYRTDRDPSLREILQVILGIVPGIATREQLAHEQFERFLSLETIDATKVREIEQIFHAVVLDKGLRECIESGDFGAVRARDASVYQGISAIGKEGVDKVVAFIQREVSLEIFDKAA